MMKPLLRLTSAVHVVSRGYFLVMLQTEARFLQPFLFRISWILYYWFLPVSSSVKTIMKEEFEPVISADLFCLQLRWFLGNQSVCATSAAGSRGICPAWEGMPGCICRQSEKNLAFLKDFFCKVCYFIKCCCAIGCGLIQGVKTCLRNVALNSLVDGGLDGSGSTCV